MAITPAAINNAVPVFTGAGASIDPISKTGFFVIEYRWIRLTKKL
jgi:hypothetical protein